VIDALADAVEPDGIVPAVRLVSARGLLERLSQHRTAHPTLRRTILDELSGSAPRSTGPGAGLLDELSDAKPRALR